MENSYSTRIKPIAQIGLTAKGIVYCLLGIFAFMAAFNIAGHSAKDASKEDVFNFIENQAGGQIMLGVIALGLLCYSLWRVIQTFGDTEQKGNDAKGLSARAMYLFSGLAYTFLAVLAIRILFTDGKKSGESQQSTIQEILSKPYGQWLVGLAAAVMFGVGIYQIWFGLSEKYKKHVNQIGRLSHQKILLSSGKIGYVARGIVWLILGWMFSKAAFYSNSAQAGDTSKAFSFLANASYGSYLLGAVGIGFICYGIFNLIRARYERL